MPTVTAEDHEAGFKVLAVEHRSGALSEVRLAAPSHRVARQLALALATHHDPDEITRACLPAGLAPEFMDRLTPSSAGLVEFCAFALTFGDALQKKMLAAGRAMADQAMDRTATAPS